MANPIFAVNALVEARRAHGADIVVLTAGEPQADTAPSIVRAAQAAVADPHTHHYDSAAGDPALRAAVATQLPGAGWTPADVLVTIGAKHALYLAVRAIADAGDEILVITPGWPGHAAAVLAAGATPVPVAAGADLQITVAALTAATTGRTRGVILASPANPTGAVASARLLQDIAAWSAATGAWIISDDVYAAFDYSGTYAHILDVAPDQRARTIIVDSVSKEHAMTGWRIGWLAGPHSVVSAAQEHVAATITHVPVALQRAATTALTDTAGPAAARTLYRARRNRLVSALSEIDGIECPTPAGGMFVFPSVAGLLRAHGWVQSADLVTHLIEHGVAVVPGEAFEAPDRLRICYAVDDSTLDTAIDRIRTAITVLQAVPV